LGNTQNFPIRRKKLLNNVPLGKLDWPGVRLRNGKPVTIVELSTLSSISRLRISIHLNKAVPFREGTVGEWGEIFEDGIWRMHSIPPKGHILTADESVTPLEVLTLVEWLQHQLDCSGGAWLRINASMPRFVEIKLNKPHNLTVEELCFPTEFILKLCKEIRDQFAG
jgi:hypothetical protein